MGRIPLSIQPVIFIVSVGIVTYFVMWLILPSIQPHIFVVLVGIGTYFVRRKFGRGWLFVLWLASTVLPTGGYVIWVYRVSPLSLPETHKYALSVGLTLFLLFLMTFGMIVWIVAIIVPP